MAVPGRGGDVEVSDGRGARPWRDVNGAPKTAASLRRTSKPSAGEGTGGRVACGTRSRGPSDQSALNARSVCVACQRTHATRYLSMSSSLASRSECAQVLFCIFRNGPGRARQGKPREGTPFAAKGGTPLPTVHCTGRLTPARPIGRDLCARRAFQLQKPRGTRHLSDERDSQQGMPRHKLSDEELFRS